MTKAATIENNRFLCLIVLAAMLIAMIPIGVAVFPSGVLAADNASVSGNFTVNNGAPIVNSVALYAHGGTAATTMNPYTNEYEVQVNVTENGTLHTLTTITVTVYYDADGVYNTGDRGSANNNTCAIMTYTHVHGGTDTWAMTNGSTWALGGDCVAPSLDGTTGTYQFVFTPGKVAQETADYASDWDIYAVASDGTGTGDGNQEGREMNWYGEITSVTSNVSFGNVTLGQTQKVSESAISATYISNGAFDEQVKTTSTWNGTTKNLTLDENGGPGDGYFSIEADDDNGSTGAVFVKNTAYTAIDTGNDTMTDESGHTQANNYLWLTLGNAGIPPETYSGTLWYAIANGS